MTEVGVKRGVGVWRAGAKKRKSERCEGGLDQRAGKKVAYFEFGMTVDLILVQGTPGRP